MGRRKWEEQWMQGKAGIISLYYASSGSPRHKGAWEGWVSGLSLRHRQARRVNGGGIRGP